MTPGPPAAMLRRMSDGDPHRAPLDADAFRATALKGRFADAVHGVERRHVVAMAPATIVHAAGVRRARDGRETRLRRGDRAAPLVTIDPPGCSLGVPAPPGR